MESGAPKLLDRVRTAIRMRHYSPRTEEAYVHWIRRYIVFPGKRHPGELGDAEVTAFLSSLAQRGVSASTQNQALSAVLFLYEVVSGERPSWTRHLVRAAAEPAAGGVVARPVNGIDYLLTWNLRHLANAVLRGKIEEAVRAAGLVPPIICTPEELMEPKP